MGTNHGFVVVDVGNGSIAAVSTSICSMQRRQNFVAPRDELFSSNHFVGPNFKIRNFEIYVFMT